MTVDGKTMDQVLDELELELEKILAVDPQTAKFYAALETGESQGDMEIVPDEPDAETRPRTD